jgi:DNA-binding NarL/FixJ family response regulator
VIRILLSVSSPALRAGLRALLLSDGAIEVLDNSLEEEPKADVVITSALGLDALSSLGTNPETASSPAILFLSDDRIDVEEMKRVNGGWGILPTDASAEELTAAIHALSQGLIVGTPALLFNSESAASEPSPLTERELEVLDLLARGLANKQVAVSLGISEHTVKFHVSSIYTKLNVTNRTEAVREGLRGGWIAL